MKNAYHSYLLDRERVLRKFERLFWLSLCMFEFYFLIKEVMR